MSVQPSLTGRTALVTGGTGGIGLEVARGLAARGAAVVVVGRDPARAAAAVDDLTGSVPGARVTPLVADLSAQREVRRAAEHVRRAHPRLDLLINNVGVVEPVRTETEDGIERTLAVNHLAPFLLTALLRPALTAADAARVVTVASSAHLAASIDLTDLQSARRYRMSTAYGRSKLANLLFHRELVRRLDGTGVTSVAVDPSGARTGLATGPGVPPLYRVMRLVAPGAATAARRVVTAALADVAGGYVGRDGAPARLSRAARDPDLARRLWDASAELVGSVPVGR